MLLLLLGCRAPALGRPDEVLLELRAAPAARVGEPLELAVLFHIPEGWHIYWENPGDSGIPTEVSLMAGALVPEGPRWTAPERFSSGELQNFGWEDHAAAFFTLSPTAEGPLELVASGSWLQCRDTCIPGSGNARLRLEVGAESPRGKDGLATFRRELPTPFPGDSGGSVSRTDDGFELHLPGPGPTDALASEGIPLVLEGTGDGGLVARAAQAPGGGRVVLVRGEGPDRRAWEFLP